MVLKFCRIRCNESLFCSGLVACVQLVRRVEEQTDRQIFNGRLVGLQTCLIKLKKKETQPKFELRVVFE